MKETERLNSINICGIHETFIDYPNEIAIIMFTRYCKWNCKHCYNIDNLKHSEILSDDYLREYLEASKELIRHIVISGGECTQEKELLKFIKYLTYSGYNVKIDTNGTNPERLKEVLPYVSAVAMDIKEVPNNFESYKRICGNSFSERDFENINKSIELLSDWYNKNRDKAYLIFRTTKFDKIVNTSEIRKYLEERYTFSEYKEQDLVIMERKTEK